MITVRSTINIAHQSVPEVIPVVQGDTGRSILFSLADFTIPTGATARYFITKPSGLAVYNDATIDGNTVLVELTAQSLAEYGDCPGQVRISVGDTVVTSFEFILHVEPFRGIDAVESSTEANIFDQAVEEAAEDFRTEAETIAAEVIESIPPDYTALSNEVDYLESALNGNNGNIVIDFNKDAYIISNQEVGETVDLTPVSSSTGYQYALLSCVEGDIFTLYGKGGSSPRLWAFIDSENKMISKSASNVTANMTTVKAPEGATKVIINYSTGITPRFAFKGLTLDKRVGDISSAFLLDREKAYRLNHDGETHAYKDITDFNDLTTEGNYYLGATSEAQGMTNIPVKNPGRLTVMSLYYGVIMQTYDANISGVSRRFWRVKNADNPWSDWNEVASKGDVDSLGKITFLLDRNKAYRLNHAGETHPYKDITDFNDLTTEGNFYLGSTPEAQGMENMPIKKPGRLTVMSLYYGVIMQIYDAAINGGRRFWRIQNTDVWGGWNEIQQTVSSTKTLIEYTPDEAYPWTQSFVVTDSYIYMTNIYDNEKEIVYKFNKYTLEKLGEIEFLGLIKHANDYVWHSSEKKIYCAIGGGTRNICVFDEEMNYESTVTIDASISISSLSGLAFDTKTNLWVVSAGGNIPKLYVMEHLTDESPIYTIDYDDGIFQGLSAINGIVWGVVSSGRIKAFIIDSDMEEMGTLVQDTRIPGASNEVEGIQIIKDYIYFARHDHAENLSQLFAESMGNVITNPLLL